MKPLHLSPSEGVVLRHVLMLHRNGIANRHHDGLEPYPMADGFELRATDALIERLDVLSEEILTENRRGAIKDVEA